MPSRGGREVNGRYVQKLKRAQSPALRSKLEKLRRDAAEAALIRDLATNVTKREMFNRLHEHLNRLADEVEAAMKSGEETP